MTELTVARMKEMSKILTDNSEEPNMTFDESVVRKVLSQCSKEERERHMKNLGLRLINEYSSQKLV